MSSAKLEAAIPTIKRPQPDVLNRPVTGIGPATFWHPFILVVLRYVDIINIRTQLLHAGEVHKNCTRFVNDNPKPKYQ